MIPGFPPAPEGRSGWPWNDISEPLPATMPDGPLWPKISVVTPSFNQGQFIEETIRSVLLQGYPNLEYIVMDGGSTDGTIDIIKKYEPWLTYWVSEADAGQSAAINKGLNFGTGEIFAWINSDDFYSPNMLTQAAIYLALHPEVGMIYGDRNVVDQLSRIVDFQRYFHFFRWQLRYMSGIPQETTFFKAEIFKKAGLLDDQLQYAMDLDLWWRVSKVTKIHYIPGFIGNYRNHRATKGNVTNSMAYSPFCSEVNLIRKKYMHRDLCPGEATILRKIHALFRRMYHYVKKEYIT